MPQKDLPLKKQIPFAVAAGIGLGLSYLTREDAIWIFPFGICASILYVLAVALKGKSVKQTLKKALCVPLLGAVIGLTLIGSYCAANYSFYGRFITNDFNSKDFSSAMGAMMRADTDIPHDHNLVCYDTREKLYSASPAFAKLKDYIETQGVYNSYGNPETKEIGSAGYFWVVRQAAFEAGFTDTALEAKEFYETLAREINEACDKGTIEAFDKCPSASVYILPYDKSYFSLTVNEIGEALKIYFFYEQTSSLAPLSMATEEQAAPIEAFTHTQSSRIAEYNTAEPHYTRIQKAAGLVTEGIAWVYRILTPIAFAAALFLMVKDLRRIFKKPFSEAFTTDTVFAVLLFGVLLSVIIRTVAVAYIHAVSFGFPAFLLYYSAAAALFVLMLAYGAARLSENVISFVQSKRAD